MNCEELRDYYELYAMGVAEDPERSEIDAHLMRRCKTCEEGLRGAMQVAALLGGAAAEAAPSPKLRSRILASVGFERRRFQWAPVWAAVAALSLLAAVYTGVRERRAADELNRVRAEVRRQSSDLARLHEAFAILNGPDTTEVTFGQGQPKPPRGKVFVSPARGTLLVASNLPAAPSGKAYEMWVIPKGGKPVPAGLFQSGSDGSAIHIHPGAIDVGGLAAVAVTLENEGGAAQPTSQPLIMAALVTPGVSR